MLSYRHSFHAGNDADVIKHVVLLALLRALARKDKPYFVLDTHAGAGAYDLGEATGGAGPEWLDGVGRLCSGAVALGADTDHIGPMPRAVAGAPDGGVPGGGTTDDGEQAPTAVPQLVRDWLRQVAVENPDGRLRHYPGSPLLIARCLRRGDRALMTELHPQDAPLLSSHLQRTRGVQVRQQDGYAALRAVLPPPERRGLVFIDPAYELADETDRLVAAVRAGLARFGHGTFAIWYPLGGKHSADQLVTRLGRLPVRKSFDVRYQRGAAHLRRRAGSGLAGCGLVLLNPPWQLDQELREALGWTAQALDPDSSLVLRWLVAETDGDAPSAPASR